MPFPANPTDSANPVTDTTRTTEKRSFWGWGVEAHMLDDDHLADLGRMLAMQFGDLDLTPQSPPPIASLHLPRPRVSAPLSLKQIVSSDTLARAGHTYGKAFRDIVRGLDGDFSSAPDLVAYPRTEQEVADILDWAGEAGAAVIPYGGGSSVTGGVEARLEGDFACAISVDLSALDQVLEIDTVSRAAQIQAGIYGPALEAVLRDHDLTLRHYPQSFEYSTLGGWIATRSGGHFATGPTHIDDFVESVRVLTPRGTLETRRLPGSGAGPSPDRLFIGSEGTLGIITSAWMRLQARPRYRASATVEFDDFLAGARTARRLAQSGLMPANCRLIDATEAMINGLGGGKHLLLVGFESADHPLDTSLDRALEICRQSGGRIGKRKGNSEKQEGDGTTAEHWRRSFLQAPYLRDGLVRLGMVAETFETACTWDRFESFHQRVMKAANRAADDICGAGLVTCRFTHVYPDGPAPYYTLIAPGRHGSRVSQWDEIKAAVSDCLIEAGGTITHHHSVGRDHKPWYHEQVPTLYRETLAAAKRTVDPDGLLNPGVLL